MSEDFRSGDFCFHFFFFEHLQESFKDCVLWNKLTLPFKSNGYSSTQTPASENNSIPWILTDEEKRSKKCQLRNESERGFSDQLHLLGHTEDGLCIITNYIRPTFTSLYISLSSF